MKPSMQRSGDISGKEPIGLTIVLKPHRLLDPFGPRLSRTEYGKRHGTLQTIIDRVTQYASGHGMTVSHASAAQHCVRLSGTYAEAQSAFEPEQIGRYRWGDRDLICRSGHLHVPPDLAGDVVAIMGFDQRPIARPHFRIRPRTTPSMIAYDPTQVARRYGFPFEATGANETIALIELGGGYDASQISSYFTAQNIHRTGTLEAVPVDGASTEPSGGPSGPDGEVQLDIEVAGAIAPAANIAVYIGGNSSRAFLDTVSAAVHDTQRSPRHHLRQLGGPETGWATQDLDAMDQLFQTAATLGVTVCAASGDSGASDGSADGSLTVDSCVEPCPWLRGRAMSLAAEARACAPQGAETAWNDGAQGGASGGGYSGHFSRPNWQTGNDQTGRGVPDVAGDADPATGYTVAIDGETTVVGGTSAVAPLWASLIALINQALGAKVGFVNAALYATPSALTDITSGNNNGYSCGPGWDPVTGLGTPKGAAVLAALKAQAASASATA